MPKKDSHEGRESSQSFFSLREAVWLVAANNLPRLWVFDRYRYLLYRLAGIRQGGECTIFGPVSVRPYGGCVNIQIGAGTFLNVATNFCVNYDTVTIGERVQIGPRVSFETLGHGLVYVPGVGRGRTSAPIVVEDEVWIGAGSTIVGGVTIGRGSVVAAGAVVTRDVPAGVLVGGVPARVIRTLDPAGYTGGHATAE
ncbi:DapH/DapD/GlmU-related protein [Flagellatimonas centrodinii]|uniref:DapH/DapD/GlmU-related protein n=1 Tax=Flagellatimonas centrodinii TaxID=2806210 RepID=UPI0023BA5C8C|nr:DapH/DapD/GlmU-related protein [Flagellatimonas centrodinii]